MHLGHSGDTVAAGSEQLAWGMEQGGGQKALVPSFCKVNEIKGLRGGVLRYGAQKILQIDLPEAENRAICGWKLTTS